MLRFRNAAVGFSLALLVGCDAYDPALLTNARRLDAGQLDPDRDMDVPMDVEVPDAGPPMDMGDPDLGPPPDMGPADSGCSTVPPVRPTLADGPDMPVRWFAMRSFDLGIGIRWQQISYDLDARNSGPDSDPSTVECAPPPGFSVPQDGPCGVDNGFGATFIPLVTLIEPGFADSATTTVIDGRLGALVRLAGWNGTPNDPVVDVALVDSPQGGGADSDFSMGEMGMTPLEFDGTDRWFGSSNAFAAGDESRPLFRDSSAFVVDNLLVARLRDGSQLVISSDSRTAAIKLTGTILTAEISDGSRALSNGILAGRWALDDIFNAMPGLAVCPGQESYTAIQEALRRSADLTVSGESTPFLLCEALSVGIGFEAVLAEFEGVRPARPVIDGCSDAGS
ncbi:MAG: hypothetical protein IT379_03545 [Deltaproteobacteria bacterium]|nr:hypothetical protein [Deltaproteobacteria bacterium]